MTPAELETMIRRVVREERVRARRRRSTIVSSKLLKIDEVAARLRIARRTAYRVAREMMHATSSPIRLPSDVVERYIAERLRGPRGPRHPLAELLAEAASSAIADLPSCCSFAGFTYLVAGGGLIKIGRARRRLPARLAGLQAQSPIPLHIVAIARSGDLEQVLHRWFAAERAHGEWFDGAAVRRWLAVVQRPSCCLRCSWRQFARG